MSRRSQFQNLSLEQALRDLEECARQPTVVQPAITLPIRSETLAPPPSTWLTPSRREVPGPGTGNSEQQAVTQTPTVLEASAEMEVDALDAPELPTQEHSRKKKVLRGAALALGVFLILAIYITWRSVTPTTAASPTVTQQHYNGLSSSQTGASANPTATTPSASSSSTIQVYIVGAIKHPGVYRLPAGSRIYQLVKAAGGTLPSADLIALNLAAPLTDGQEVYVLSIGEVPPNYTSNPSGPTATSTSAIPAGQLVNINTATESEMRQVLHVSATTAQKIIAYRTQHGPYTSVDQLLQVISKSIYDRIKNMVTV